MRPQSTSCCTLVYSVHVRTSSSRHVIVASAAPRILDPHNPLWRNQLGFGDRVRHVRRTHGTDPLLRCPVSFNTIQLLDHTNERNTSLFNFGMMYT
jgi:hypothetical protein